MAAPIIANPNVAQRHDQTWWAAPIGLGMVTPNPVFASDLPTTDPAVAGQLWQDPTANNVIKESQG